MTLVPYDKKLMKMDLLGKTDIDYINAYHVRCLKEVGPVLKEKGWELGLNWLVEHAKPVKV